MKPHQTETTKRVLDRTGFESALTAARTAALRRHAAAGVPVVIWRDGKVVEVSAESLLTERGRVQGEPAQDAA